MTTPSDQLIDKWFAYGRTEGIEQDVLERGKWVLLNCLLDRDKWPQAKAFGAKRQAYITMSYRDGEGLVYLCEVFSIRNTNLAARRLRAARKVLFRAVSAAL